MTNPASQLVNSQPKQTSLRSSFTWSIGITGILVLFLIVLAIVIPEYLKYQFQMSQVKLQDKQIDFQQERDKKRIETLNASAAPPTSQQPSSVKPESLTQPPSREISNSSAQTSVAASESKITPISIDSSSLFDSYGRFVTLLVGLLSVLGIFFGYFVRKSIHEMEEKMETKIDKILANWKEEKTQIKDSYEKQSDQLNLKLGEVGSLKAEVDGLKFRLTEYLDNYDKSKQKYTAGPARPSQDPTSVAHELDEAMSTESQIPTEPVKNSAPIDIEEK
jgi:predicted Holliday junction resolvase-like endonuclease